MADGQEGGVGAAVAATHRCFPARLADSSPDIALKYPKGGKGGNWRQQDLELKIHLQQLTTSKGSAEDLSKLHLLNSDTQRGVGDLLAGTPALGAAPSDG